MKARLTVAALAAGMLILSGTYSPAKPLLEDGAIDNAARPDRIVQGGEFLPGGAKGWKAKSHGDRLRYALPPSSVPREQGTLELAFHVGPLPQTGSEAVCVIEDAAGSPVLSLYFVPEFNLRGVNESVLLVDTVPEAGYQRIGEFISLGKVVPRGDTVHLAITWSRTDSGANGMYMNGRRLAAFLRNRTLHSVAVSPSTGLADFLPSAAAVLVGSDRLGKHLMSGSTATRFAVHDRVLSPGEMAGAVSAIRSLTDDTFKVTGISRKLVAGDTVTVTAEAAPGGTATFDMGKVSGISMAAADTGGLYRGKYTIRPGDDYENGQIVGHFVSADNVIAEPATSSSKWTIDTKPVVTFAIERKDLPADSAAKSRIKLVAKDANGNPVKGRHLKLTLATTDEYTGTVGAGVFGKEVGGSVETRWRGETDSWGEVEFDYTAGFAAKTVILAAKDLDSGGVTVDYVTAFKEASIDIALVPPVNRAAARRALQYILKVEASRTELTADGRSRSVIRATLLDPNGTSVSGDPVSFALSSPNGTLKTVTGTTDASGTATAEYTAGKKIGIVVVTATATLRNASGNVSIVLLSDAPAKIYLKARPETLPADGMSRADIQVKVTDINENPNRDTKVEFKVSRGGGRMDYLDRITDRFGETANRYIAGTAPGIATILATVRSRIPTEVELMRAKNVIFAPWSDQGEEIRVAKWLKKKGESAAKGEPIVEYTYGRSKEVHTIVAPYDLKMGDIHVEYWNNAEVGQTLANVTPVVR